MGTARCWVCAGCGTVERRTGISDCPSCAATGVCRYCPAAADEQVTIRLDPPAVAAAVEQGEAAGPTDA